MIDRTTFVKLLAYTQEAEHEHCWGMPSKLNVTQIFSKTIFTR